VGEVHRIVYAQGSFALPIQLNEIFGSRGPSIYGMNMSFNAFIVDFTAKSLKIT